MPMELERWENFLTSVSIHCVFALYLGSQVGKSWCSSIGNIKHQNIGSAHLGQVIHDSSDAFLLYHCGDSDPAFFFKRVDGGRPAAGGYFCGAMEVVPWDVVLAQDVFLCSYWGGGVS